MVNSISGFRFIYIQRFILMMFCVITYNFICCSQTISKVSDFEIYYKKIDPNKEQTTRLLEFIENNMFSFQTKELEEAYFDFVKSKEKDISNKTGIDYGRLCYLLALKWYNRKMPFEAYKYLDKANSALQTIAPNQIHYYGDLLKLNGEVYFNFHRNQKAKQFLLLALNNQQINTKTKISIYNTLGLVFRDENKADSSVYFLKQGLQLAKSTKSDEWKGIIIGNLGYAHYINNDLGLAKLYFETDVRLSMANRQTESSINALSSLIHIAIEEKNDKILLRNMHLLDSLIATTDDRFTYSVYLKARSEFMTYFGKYKDALIDYEKSIVLKDSVNRNLRLVDFQNTEFQIEYEKNKAKIELIREKQRKSQLNYLILVLGLSMIIVVCVVLLKRLKTKKAIERRILNLKNKNITLELDNNKRELNRVLKSLKEKNEIVEMLSRDYIESKNDQIIDIKEFNREEIYDKIQSFRLLTEDDLMEFKNLFNRIYPNFYHNLTTQYHHLSNAEIRLAMLIKMELSTYEMAQILGISKDSVRKTNLRLRNKLNIDDKIDLINFIKII